MFIIVPDLSYHQALCNIFPSTTQIGSIGYVRNAMEKSNNQYIISTNFFQHKNNLKTQKASINPKLKKQKSIW